MSFLFWVIGCAGRPSSTPLAESPAEAPSQPAPASTASAAPESELLPASGTTAATDGAQPEGAETASAKTNPTQNPSGAAPDPASYGFPKDTLILHVGDSFAGSLGVPLGKRFKAAGMRTVLEFQTASYVPTWASGKELPGYVDKYRPSLIIITLGANEVELTNPEQRASGVKRLVGKLGGRPCVWVIPPLWKPDTGIFNVIRQNAAPCRILESDSIVHDVARKPDKIHPSDAAREIWADAVLAWLARERVGAPDRPWELRPAP
ncbi:MAG TPA: SGNH/GDSL hydrolase family protein [Polyangiaceae bacterium]